MAQWWGPRGFTLTSHSKDIKTGGHWHYTMHGPDGADYINKTKYLEVIPYKKLHYDHGGNDERAPLFRVTVLFSESRGKTTMEMTMSLPTAEAAENTRRFIRKAGGDSTWDRFAEYLNKRVANKELFVINRSFDAPIDELFDLWTDPKKLAQWLPPTGSTMEFLKADIRPGGSSFYKMTSPAMTMYGRADYLTITKPHTLIYTQQFCDEKGNISRHPKAPTWPETILTTVTFTAEGPHQTRVTVHWEPFGKATPEERSVFLESRASMTMGWTGSFDTLESSIDSTIPS